MNRILKIILLFLVIFLVLMVIRNNRQVKEPDTIGNNNNEAATTTAADTKGGDTNTDINTNATASSCNNWSTNISGSNLELVNLNYQNKNRSYYIYLPKSLIGCTNNSLLMALHGGEGSGEKLAGLDLVSKAEKEKFILVLPNSPDQQWNDGREVTASSIDDVGFLTAIVDQTVAKYGVSANKAFVVGVSNGGMMSQRLACDASNKFAGFASIVANLPAALEGSCSHSAAKPMVFFHGTADKIMPYNGGEIRSSKALGLGVGGTVISAAATEEFWTTKNRCGSTATVKELPDKYPSDGTTVSEKSYTNCANNADIEVFTITGGGHNWPGSNQSGNFITGNISKDVVATDEIFNFFSSYGL